MVFNKRFDFQFGFFTTVGQDGMKIENDKLKSIREHFNRDQGSRLRINIPGSQMQDSLVQIGENLVPVPSINWPGTGAWRMTWSPIRFDVFMSVLTYEEISGTPVALSESLERVLPSLINAMETLATMQCVASRALLVVTAEKDLEEDRRWGAMRRLAPRYLSESLVTASEQKKIGDWSMRADWDEPELLPGGETPVFRNETIGTKVAFSGTSRQTTFFGQWDVNTSPARGAEGISSEDLAAFYRAAERWISPRVDSVREALS